MRNRIVVSSRVLKDHFFAWGTFALVLSFALNSKTATRSFDQEARNQLGNREVYQSRGERMLPPIGESQISFFEPLAQALESTHN